MIPRIKKLSALDDFLLSVVFDDGHKVIYDVKDDIKNLPSFNALEVDKDLFFHVQLDSSRTCVFWNDQIDLASDSIYEYGKEVEDSLLLVADDTTIQYQINK